MEKKRAKRKKARRYKANRSSKSHDLLAAVTFRVREEGAGRRRHIPKNKRCSFCAGTGLDKNKIDISCLGTGLDKNEVDMLSLNPFFFHCEECKGSGRRKAWQA